jgi:hypothetical protein
MVAKIKQMGFAMQDAVTNSFKWAVAQGIADPKARASWAHLMVDMTQCEAW